ncbi:MAG: cell division protein FtsZ [Verrucomicrobiota bacterium]
MNPESAPPLAARLPSAKIIGLGGAGLSALENMARTDLQQLPMAALHTNTRLLDQATIAGKHLFGTQLVRGLGCGADPDLGKAAAEEESEAIQKICAGAELIFLVAGLGGGTGSGAAPVVARIARETGALVLAVVTSPFEFEGQRRQRQAQAALQLLRTTADAVICLPNHKISKLIDERTPLTETFSKTNELLVQAVRSIWQMLSVPGLINVGFGDLCAVLRGRHSESGFAMAEAEGEFRVREVVDQILANPLLDAGQMIAEADAMLVSIIAGPDLTMAEINRVMEQFNRATENAQVIVGAAIAPDWKKRLAVTVIVARRATKSDVENVEPRGEMPGASETPAEGSPDIDTTFFNAPVAPRPASRFVPPPPALDPAQATQMLASTATRRKKAVKMRQGQLPLEIVSKGRFEKSEPTIHHGQDLDVPTYIRRGIVLN